MKTSIASQTIGGVTIKGGGIFLGLLSSVVLARLLGPEKFGVYAFSLSIIQVLMIPASLGFFQLFVREIASNRLLQRDDRILGLLKLGFGLILMVSLLLAFVIAVVPWTSWSGPEAKDTLFWAALNLPLISLLFASASAFKGFGKILLGQFMELAVAPLVFLLIVCGFWLFTEKVFSAPLVMAFQAGASGCGLLVSSWLLYRVVTISVDRTKAQYEARAWLLSALTFMLYFGLSSFNNNVSILLLGFFSTEADVGLFQLAFRGAGIVLFGLAALGSSVAPRISALNAEGNKDGLQKLIKDTSYHVSLYSILVTIVFYIFADQLITVVYGVEFSEAVLPFKVLCCAQMLNVCFGYPELTLNMMGHERWAMVCVGVGFLINLILNLILIPSFGLIGASVATSVGILSWKMLAMLILYRKEDLKCGPLLFLKGVKL